MQTAPSRAGGSILWPFLFGVRPRPLIAAAAMALVVLGCTTVWAGEVAGQDAGTSVGHASWYGHEFGRRLTASGDRFDPAGLTGAHRTLPLGSRVRVTNLHNGRSVLVTITDRGPFRRHRMIDLSLGAARLLGMVQQGIARVRIELISS